MSADLHIVNPEYMRRAGKFLQLWKRLGAKTRSNPHFNELDRLYSEKKRKYHNWKHIDDGLLEFKEAKHLAENPDAVELAFFYHDAIYDSKAKDNEEKSAELMFHACIDSQLKIDFINHAKSLVMITKQHLAPKDVDEMLMIDLDLSIFGKPEKIFDEYEKNIRKEYSWVSDENFRKGRSQVLDLFLAREEIYKTDYFRKKYEKKAKENLERSIERLQKGILIS
jgi:predicted metal-dependent HD superfamily phosphohydrolase